MAIDEEYDEYNTALQLPEDTIREAQAAVARNEPLKEYLRESGAGNNTDIIRRFAENPDIDPVEALGPVHGERYAAKRRGSLGPTAKADPSPGQSFGSFLLGK